MNEDGLGTLAVLPREVRDIVYPHLATERSNCPWRISQRPWAFSIRREPATQISSQLRREFLEAYLREGDFFEPTEKEDGKWTLDLFLSFMHPLADIATHVRRIGIDVDSFMFDNYDWDCFNLGYSCNDLTVQRELLRRAEQLRCYHEHYRIPAHRLYLYVVYNSDADQIYGEELNFIDCLHDDPLSLFLFFSEGIKIYMGSREASVERLDYRCHETEQRLYAMIDKIIAKLSKDETAVEVEEASEWWPRHRAVLLQARAMIPRMISHMIDYHMVLIDKLMDYWQEKDEFEKFCLGDFFALAEAW
ncbi:hypothetical protein KCU67_g8233, partial [Aureobasidium melanogenum]